MMEQYGSFSTTNSLEGDSMTTCGIQATGSSLVVTLSIPLVTVCSWITASLSPRNMTCARRPGTVTPQQRALARIRVALWTSFREWVSGGHGKQCSLSRSLKSLAISPTERSFWCLYSDVKNRVQRWCCGADHRGTFYCRCGERLLWRFTVRRKDRDDQNPIFHATGGEHARSARSDRDQNGDALIATVRVFSFFRQRSTRTPKISRCRRFSMYTEM